MGTVTCIRAPRHGYELDRVIEQRGIREWTTLGFSSIYYLLDRLAGLGLIETSERGGRRRASYRLTEAGWARLPEQSACSPISAGRRTCSTEGAP